jgi:Tat protein translocase TatB subunit
MLDFGFSEIVLTSAIALIVLGPEKLPKVARQVGNWMGRARAMARQLTDQLEREVNAEELLKATKSNTGTNTGGPITSAPTPYDTASFPSSTMTSTAPAYTPPQSLAPVSNTVYSNDPVASPHGADWHPAAPETKVSNE